MNSQKSNKEANVAPATEVVADRFQSAGHTEERADKITLMTSGGAIASVLPRPAVTVYSTKSNTIDMALEALGELGKSTTAGKKADSWTGPVNRILDGVEAIVKAQPFPFVEVRLETQRRENSRKTRALILQIADMLGALLQLHNVQDPELEAEPGKSVQGRIQVLMKDIYADIKACGALIDAYHKHSLTSKFFFSDSYASQFKDCGETLVNRKGDIIFALTIRTTLTVDEVRGIAKANNELLQQLITVVEHKTKQQEELEKTIVENGGRQKVLNSDELLSKISKTIQATLVMEAPEERSERTSTSSAPPSFREMYELRLSLDVILQESAVHYAQKLDAQVKAITDDIQSYFDAGPYERVHHPDIRELWKQMNWRYSVRSRDFFKALQEFYFDKFSKDSLYGGDVTKHAQDGPQMPRWKQRRVSRATSEAFDTDGSGFIRISEVNNVTKALTEDWTMLQALSYFAQGWSIETAIYARKIFGLLQGMRDSCDNISVHNGIGMIGWFMGSTWCNKINWLILGAGEKDTIQQVSNPLDDLVSKNMASMQERIKKSLKHFLYNIDSPTSLGLIVGPGRFEQYQHEFIKYAKDHVYPNTPADTKILFDLDFFNGSNSLFEIEHAIDARIEDLKATSSHRGQDPESRISTFGGGLYMYCSKREFPLGIEFEPLQQWMPLDVYQLEPEPVPFVPARGEWPLVTDVPNSTEPSSIPESIMGTTVLDTFYRLTVSTLNMRTYECYGSGPQTLSEEEMEQLAMQRELIPTEVQDNCMNAAKSAIRQSYEHLSAYCDNCDACPIQNIRHKCMFCAGGDVHKPWHPMLLMFRPSLQLDHNLLRPFRERYDVESQGMREMSSNSVGVFGSEQDAATSEEHRFTCTHCKRSLSGTRFLYFLEPGSRDSYVCPDCYAKLLVDYDIQSLPKEYHRVLRFALPQPEDEPGELAEVDHADDSKAVAGIAVLNQLQSRLETLENKFASLESKLESKLDRLMDILS
ncbi:hypothetical protein BDP27DRAFT_1371208 [Rhodocollybia butyracea]|uniref:ZZ-type domain-containing protein n=1 Tax=Rhodocollybia butyracea TaxID=206335 RepID=A0A9P5P9E8_9AGAR|nr:hypothetical protein BDP27DRAFT_1371208 [Rhodocollybia butyracea]